MFKLAAICVIVSFVIFFLIKKNERGCRENEFRFGQMTSCHLLLNCNDVKDIELHELIGSGGVKAVYRARWKNLTIAVSYLREKNYESDFWHGLQMLQKYKDYPFIVKLIGFCEDENSIFTEYHKHGNALNLFKKIKPKKDGITVRLKYCLNYAKILQMLHNKTAVTTVNCDSNTVEKTLSQLLITNNLDLILNDVDSLAEVNKTIKCGKKQLFGDFVAPEQLWRSTGPFDDRKMRGYDEKTDIWKVPAICNYFLGDVPNAVTVRYRLFDLHDRCKNVNPKKRPGAEDLVKEYSRVLSELEGDWL